MKFILIPYEIHDVFSLEEALNWIAFKAPAIGSDEEFDCETFQSPRSVYAEDLYPYKIGDSLETNIPDQPEYPTCPSPHTIEILAKNDPTFANNKKQHEALKKKSEETFAEYEQKDRAWKDAYSEALESAKASLFLALKKSDLKARGSLSYVLKEGIEKALWIKDENEGYWEEVDPIPDSEILSTGALYLCKLENNPDAFSRLSETYPDKAEIVRKRFENRISEIPAKFWRMEGINWEDSTARSPDGMYMEICIDRDSLFSLFPPAPPVPVSLNTYSGLIAFGDEMEKPQIPKKSRRGRPPSINWEAFHLEMARKVSNDDLPKKQESCIADIQQWCINQWGSAPERSTLLEKISPYYKMFKSK